jgi:hypothetical protein
MFNTGSVFFGGVTAPDATVKGADNGLSLDGTDVVLGQDVGEVGNPAALLNSREVPIGIYDLTFVGTTGKVLVSRIRIGNDFSLAPNRNNIIPFVVLTDKTDPSATDAGYGGASIDIRTSYAAIAPPVTSDQIQAGMIISASIKDDNTQNWGAPGDAHPKWTGASIGLAVASGAAGVFNKSAAIFATFINRSATATLEEVNLIDLTYDHTNPTTVNHANGIRIADFDFGNNGIGVFLVLGDTVAPPAGRWGIYDLTGFNSFFKGAILNDTGNNLLNITSGNTLIGPTGTETLVMLSDGRVYGTRLHNNVNAITGTTNQYIASGTYTPTATAVTNVTTVTPALCQWSRVGNVVTVSGAVNCVPTAAAVTLTEFRLSLPIASTFSIAANAGGSGGSRGTAALGPTTRNISIEANVANNDILCAWGANATDAVGRDFNFTFTYLIL